MLEQAKTAPDTAYGRSAANAVGAGMGTTRRPPLTLTDDLPGKPITLHRDDTAPFGSLVPMCVHVHSALPASGFKREQRARGRQAVDASAPHAKRSFRVSRH